MKRDELRSLLARLRCVEADLAFFGGLHATDQPGEEGAETWKLDTSDSVGTVREAIKYIETCLEYADRNNALSKEREERSQKDV